MSSESTRTHNQILHFPVVMAHDHFAGHGCPNTCSINQTEIFIRFQFLKIFISKRVSGPSGFQTSVPYFRISWFNLTSRGSKAQGVELDGQRTDTEHNPSFPIQCRHRAILGALSEFRASLPQLMAVTYDPFDASVLTPSTWVADNVAVQVPCHDCSTQLLFFREPMKSRLFPVSRPR